MTERRDGGMEGGRGRERGEGEGICTVVFAVTVLAALGSQYSVLSACCEILWKKEKTINRNKKTALYGPSEKKHGHDCPRVETMRLDRPNPYPNLTKNFFQTKNYIIIWGLHRDIIDNILSIPSYATIYHVVLHTVLQYSVYTVYLYHL